jgi:hypothetical protein
VLTTVDNCRQSSGSRVRPNGWHPPPLERRPIDEFGLSHHPPARVATPAFAVGPAARSVALLTPNGQHLKKLKTPQIHFSNGLGGEGLFGVEGRWYLGATEQHLIPATLRMLPQREYVRLSTTGSIFALFFSSLFFPCFLGFSLPRMAGHSATKHWVQQQTTSRVGTTAQQGQGMHLQW